MQIDTSLCADSCISHHESLTPDHDSLAAEVSHPGAHAGSVVLTPTGNGTVILRMMIEESSDLSVWENSEESVEVELPLAEGKKFLRFALK